MRNIIPFSAIIGQERLKKALILNAINPRIGGVLIKGEKGTAKSTAVRAMAELLPEIEVVADCEFGCNPEDPGNRCPSCKERFLKDEKLPVSEKKMPVVELPLGATEDRIVGTLDIEKALKDGIKALQPGLLADANRGILYIDEINLLDDHLVDVLLDAAAMGWNVIEREGISLSHPANFILVGTMNPEEGDLRPQLLDRIGLSVEVAGIMAPRERIKVIKLVEAFETSPEQVLEDYVMAQEELKKRIIAAKADLKGVKISTKMLEVIVKLCIELNVDGHRADILIARTAKVLAAYHGRNRVSAEDIKEAAELVLPHRIKTQPFQKNEPIEDKIQQMLQNSDSEGREDDNEVDSAGDEQNQERGETEEDLRDGSPQENEPEDGKAREEGREDMDEGIRGEVSSKGQDENEGENQDYGRESSRIFESGMAKKIGIDTKKDKKLRRGSGRRAVTLTSYSGKYVGFRNLRKGNDIALGATLRASILRENRVNIKKEDLREKIRKRKKSTLIVFVVDASGSMGAMDRMKAAKGAVLDLLRESYQKRDRVAFVAFKGSDAEVLLPPTSSIELAASKLEELPTGGKTPLSKGLYRGYELIKGELLKDRDIIPILVLISDGRANVPMKKDPKDEIFSLALELKDMNPIIIDAESGFLKLGYNRDIARLSGGSYHILEELTPETIKGIVKNSGGII